MRLRPFARERLVCRRAVELIADYVDDALPRGDRRRLELHLDGCPLCSEYLRQLRATLAASTRLKAVAPQEPSPAAAAALAQLYRDWLSDR